MKLFAHRGGSNTFYGDPERNNGALKLADCVTGDTYWLKSSWTDGRQMGRISVRMTADTMRIKGIEGRVIDTDEFSERFEPVVWQVGDWVTEKTATQKQLYKVVNLTEVDGVPFVQAELEIADGRTQTRGFRRDELKFVATNSFGRSAVKTEFIRKPNKSDIVILNDDISKIGVVLDVDWHGNYDVRDYYNNEVRLGANPFISADKLTTMLHYENRDTNVWGSSRGSLEETMNPRVKCAITDTTHQIIQLRRTNTTAYRLHDSLNRLIPQVFNQYVPQLKRSVPVTRYSEGAWVIDITNEDHETPNGNVSKTWYRAYSDGHPSAMVKFVMAAMDNWKKSFEEIRTAEVTPQQAEALNELDGELLTETERLMALMETYRAQAEQRRLAAEAERQRQEQLRQEEERRQREEEMKKTIWAYHVRKTRVQTQ